MSLHTRLQISHDCSLLCGTDEISLAITVRSSEQLVGKVYTLAIDTEKCISLNRLKSLSKFIRVITELPNSEQSYKVKTHKYINRQNQSTTGKL